MSQAGSLPRSSPSGWLPTKFESPLVACPRRYSNFEPHNTSDNADYPAPGSTPHRSLAERKVATKHA